MRSNHDTMVFMAHAVLLYGCQGSLICACLLLGASLEGCLQAQIKTEHAKCFLSLNVGVPVTPLE